MVFGFCGEQTHDLVLIKKNIPVADRLPPENEEKSLYSIVNPPNNLL
jgi:hypothetical protein